MENTGNPFPVVGIGASAEARAAQAGFDRHFTKPVDISSLQAFFAETPLKR